MATSFNTVSAPGDMFCTASAFGPGLPHFNSPVDGVKRLQWSTSIRSPMPPVALKLPLSQRKEQRLTPINVLRSSCVTFGTCETGEGSLYALLGLEHNVSVSRIKSAYRQMAKRYHPDVCSAADGANCARMFFQVQEAYEVLSDPHLRADYDYSLLNPFHAQSRGKGLPTASTRGRRQKEEQADASAAWKLQWEAQISRLHKRQTKSWSGESWGERMRRRNPTCNC